jgi:tRNA threonylcarbamoyl adenosine modification protein YjeE
MQKDFILDEEDIENFSLAHITLPCIIFLRWDLGSWKTTLSGKILQQFLPQSGTFTSPTYVYYNTYGEHHHFDLYRLHTYEEFRQIWGEEILDGNKGIILIEWPELIEKYYKADIEISIHKLPDERKRKICIKYINY